jgi:hypothetical protein
METTTRKARATEALSYLRDCRPEYRHQAIDQWLALATGAEVRRNWRRWMGAMPPWAVR